MLPVILFAPALFGRVLLAPDDGYSYYLPIHELAADAWRSGHIPSWNPFQLSGAPLLATQAGAFYPLNLVFLLLPSVYANNLYIVLNIAIGALGACLLARRLTGDDAAAVVAGLAFSSSGFVYGHIAHQPLLAGAVWMPWVLFAYDRLTERRSVSRFLLAGVTLAMAGLTGHTQMFFLIVLVLAVYGLATPTLSDMRKREGLKTFLLTLLTAAVIELLLPTSAWILVFFMVFFGLALALGAASAVRSSLARRRMAVPQPCLWLIPSVAVVGAGLAAVQLLPTGSLVHETIRSQPGISLATSFSFSPSHLPLLLFPYLFGNSHPVAPFDALYRGDWNLTELAGYPGLAAVVLAVAGSSRIRRDPRALALGLAGLIALVLALGRETGFGALLSFVPVYGQLRAWGRYSVVIDLAVAIFAAYGVAHLRSAAGNDRRAARRAAWAAVASLGIVAVVVPLLPGVRHFVVGGHRHLLAIGVPLAAGAMAAACTLLIGRFDRLVVALCCLIVAADGALSFGAFFEWRDSPSPAAARALYSPDQRPPWGLPRAPDGEISRYLFAGEKSQPLPYFPQVTDLKRIHSANGYEPLLSSRYGDVVGGMVETGWLDRPGQFLDRRSSVLDVLRISTVLAPTDQAPKLKPPWFTSSTRFGELIRYTYRPRLPSAFLIGHVRRVNSQEAVSAAVGRTPFDPRRSALVEGDCEACDAMKTRGLAGRVTRTQWGTNTVNLTIEATRPALLVVSQSWFPGWSASIDGRKQDVIRADAIVLGVPVPVGRHRVELSYFPPGLAAGALVSSVTLAGFGIVPLLLYARKRSRRSRRRFQNTS